MEAEDNGKMSTAIMSITAWYSLITGIEKATTNPGGLLLQAVAYIKL